MIVWTKHTVHETVVRGALYRIEESSTKGENRVNVYRDGELVGWAFDVEHAKDAIANDLT